MKFIHITDFHLSAPGSTLWGLDPHDRVDRCLADIERWHGDAAFCVITGDLADNGEPEAYAWLAERLERFALKTFLMIGNHDRPEAFCTGFPEVQRDPNGFVQYRHDTEAGRFLFLDTYKGPVSEGQYCEKRLRWLEDELQNAAGQPVWLFMHHPPFDVGMPYMDRIKLEDHEAFAEAIGRHEDIRHIFFGHVHRAILVNWQGIPCSALPGINHQVPLKRESVGTAYSIEPPMYGVVLINGRQTIVHFDACLDRGPAQMGDDS